MTNAGRRSLARRRIEHPRDTWAQVSRDAPDPKLTEHQRYLRGIERRIAVATGRGFAGIMMRLRLASYINDLAIDLPGGFKIREACLQLRDKYTGEPILEDYIWADLSRRSDDQKVLLVRNGEQANAPWLTEEQENKILHHRAIIREEMDPFQLEDLEWWEAGRHKPTLTGEQAKLVVGNLGDVRAAAESYAKKNRARNTDLQVLISELEVVGLRICEELAPKYDPNHRGYQGRTATFKTFAGYRVRGAMVEYLRNRTLTMAVSVGGTLQIDIASKYFRRQPKVDTWDKEEHEKRRPSRRIGKHGMAAEFNSAGRRLQNVDPVLLNTLVMRLPHKQRVVFRGMKMTEPPRTRISLAREIGLPETQLPNITRILRQAQRNIDRWLAEIEVIPPTPIHSVGDVPTCGTSKVIPPTPIHNEGPNP